MTKLPPTRAQCPRDAAMPLSALTGWWLLPHCGKCRVMRQLPVNVLAERVGSGTLLRDLLPRLRCTKCGEQPRAVLLEDGQGPRRREVWVLGCP